MKFSKIIRMEVIAFSLKLLGLYIGLSLFVCLYNLYLKKKGYDGIEWISCFDPIKWLSFGVGWFVWLFIRRFKHVFEQYIERYYNDDCSRCIAGGRCVGVDQMGDIVNTCGCSPGAKASSPLESCSGRYDPIIWRRGKYQKERKEYPMKIKVIYGEQ